VVLADLIGLGFSSKPESFSYTIGEHADSLLMLWAKLNVSGGHLLCHDLGDSICTEILARMHRKLLPAHYYSSGGGGGGGGASIGGGGAENGSGGGGMPNHYWPFPSVTFTNGGLHIELASFRISQVMLRMKGLSALLPHVSNFWFTRRQLLSVSSVSSPPPESCLRDIFEINALDDGTFRLPRIAKYIDERFALQGRWLLSLRALCSRGEGNSDPGRVRVRVRVVWGAEDTVAPVAIAETLRAELDMAATQVAILPRLGHFLMLEDAGAFVDAVVA
jgi:pimeloyl-ACP methyl ester carboxylesterase